MKLLEAGDHILATFTAREKESGLLDHLEVKMPPIGTNYSEDRLVWRVNNNTKDKFLRLIKKFNADNAQQSLF